MRLDTLCLLLIGYFLHPTHADDNNKDVRIAPGVFAAGLKPQPSHQVENKSPNLDDHHGQGGQIIFHNRQYTPEDGYSHQHHFVYNPDKKEKYKHKKASSNDEKKRKKKYGDDGDFEEVLQNYDSKPEEKSDDGDGFKQSYHTEHYEVKKINPNARYPGEKYIIQGAYKVQETDPWGKPTTSFHEYDSPISKIAASILSKYDYTNFRPGESDDYNKNEDFDKDDSYAGYDDGKKKKSKIGFEDDDDHDYSVSVEKKNYATPKSDRKGYNYDAAVGYIDYLNAKSEHHLPFNAYTLPKHDEESSELKQADDETEDYSVPEKKDKEVVVGNLKERPADIEYVVPHKTVSYDDGAADHAREAVESELEYEFEKEFGHLIHPGHTVDPGYKYDSEWEKRLIEHIYGQDHAASNKFVQKVKPIK